MARQLALFLFIGLGSSLFAQQGKWLFSYEIGLGAGWWVYDKGLTDTLPQIHRGYDRTHLSFLTHQSLSVAYSTPRFMIGIQGGINTLEDPTMVGSDHRRGAFRRYELSRGGNEQVPLPHFAAKIGVNLINKEKFRLTPIAVLGANWVQAFHSEVMEFDRRFYRAGELQFAISVFPNLNLLLYPRFTNILLKDSNVPFEHAKHNVYGISLHTGLELSI